jgi:hypothetical protein
MGEPFPGEGARVGERSGDGVAKALSLAVIALAALAAAAMLPAPSARPPVPANGDAIVGIPISLPRAESLTKP